MTELTQKAPRTKPLVLLVDDSVDNRDMYAMYLSLRGFEVAEAGDGRGGVDQAIALLPDIVVMDLYLPDMTGEQVILRMHEDPRTQHIPVIIVSGAAMEPEPKRGWDVFMRKPCAPDVLTDQICRLLAIVPLP